jgi:hypothetical protein
MPERELISGEEIKLGGETFVLPPFNMKFIVEERISMMDKLNKAVGEKRGRLMVEMIHKALVRNYPDMTVDRLMELLDPRSIGKIMALIPALNDFSQPGEIPPGEQ